MKMVCYLLMFVCSSLYSGESPLYIKYVEQIQNDFAKYVLQQERAQLLCTGGALSNDVLEINLDFDIIGRATIDQARRLFVKYAEPMIRMINSNRKIRPYLRNYPATINDISLSFYFSPNYPHPYVRSVSNYYDKIWYTFYGQNEYKESYEEALRIMQSEHGELKPIETVSPIPQNNREYMPLYKMIDDYKKARSDIIK